MEFANEKPTSDEVNYKLLLDKGTRRTENMACGDRGGQKNMLQEMWAWAEETLTLVEFKHKSSLLQEG